LLTIEHDGGDVKRLVLEHLADITRLLLELPNSACFGRLLRVHKACREFYHGLVDRWTPLLLKKDPRFGIRVGWVFKNGCNTDTIYIATLGPGETFPRFPCALIAFRIEVCDSAGCLSIMH
jgi:hypothetical protein